MTNCNTTKRLIDEAEQPDLLPFEATNHLNSCAPCRLFADERASLRGLLNTMPRVSAPFNFDAQLKARMTTAKAKPSFAWLSPALYLRFGAASAVLLIAVFVAQYNGMFSLTNERASLAQGASSTVQTSGNNTVKPAVTTPRNPSVATLVIATASDKGNRRVRPVAIQLEDEAMSNRVPGLLIVRPSGREVELPMLPVSLGAQQQLINRSGRSSVQPIAISF